VPFAFIDNTQADEEMRRSKNPFLLAALGMDEMGDNNRIGPFGDSPSDYPDTQLAAQLLLS